MKLVKAVGCVVLACATLWLASPARAAEWATDYKAALDQAQKSGKVVLADFTGTDWCVWCKKLKAEVFDTDAFKAWADKNVVLLELDFPRQKELPAELKAQNDKLQQKFAIRGFPTVLFLDGDGKELGRAGYLQGGPTAWTKNADAILATARPTITPLTSLVAAIKQAKDESKAVLLVSARTADEAKQADALFKNADLAKYARFRLVVACHDTTAAESDVEAARNLFQKARPTEKAILPRVMVIDAAGEKVLFSSQELLTSGPLLAAMRKALPPIAYDGSWIEDFARAEFMAADLNRPMLLDFTGSDWCVWCQKLDKEVFSTDAFKAYAKGKLVLVKLDFPKQSPIAEALKKQNVALAQKFAIEGFPTLILLSPVGARLGEMGYMEGGPDKFLPALKKNIGDGPAASKE